MKKEALENINSELFNSFDPEQELWIIGGEITDCVTGRTTNGPNGYDSAVDSDYDLPSQEEGAS